MAKRRFDDTGGPTQRSLRVGELIRRALSDILLRGDVHDDDLAGVSVTVSEVRCSPDLRHATAFVLPLGGKGTDTVLAALARNQRELRRLVTKAISVKYSPDLRFEADRSFDQMDETRRLLASDPVRRDLDG